MRTIYNINYITVKEILVSNLSAEQIKDARLDHFIRFASVLEKDLVNKLSKGDSLPDDARSIYAELGYHISSKELLERLNDAISSKDIASIRSLIDIGLSHYIPLDENMIGRLSNLIGDDQDLLSFINKYNLHLKSMLDEEEQSSRKNWWRIYLIRKNLKLLDFDSIKDMVDGLIKEDMPSKDDSYSLLLLQIICYAVDNLDYTINKPIKDYLIRVCDQTALRLLLGIILDDKDMIDSSLSALSEELKSLGNKNNEK